MAKSTYLRVERGDPTVTMGIYAMALFVLGFGCPFGDLVDPSKDSQALLLDAERLPKRIRIKREPKPL